MKCAKKWFKAVSFPATILSKKLRILTSEDILVVSLTWNFEYQHPNS